MSQRRAEFLVPSSNGIAVYPSAFMRWLFRWRYGSAEVAPPDAMLTSRALLIWSERPDLQSVFDLQRAAGRAQLFWWYLLHAYHEMGLDPDEDGAAILRTVSRPLPRLARHYFTPITWLVYEACRRSGLGFGNLCKPAGQRAALGWFFAKGLMEKRLGDFLTLEQARSLLAPQPDMSGVPRIAALIWEADPPLRQQFPNLDDSAFLTWCRGEGARDFPILSHPLIALAPPWRPRRSASKRFGVNVIGHAFGRSGLSEDVRAAALSLNAVGIPFAIHNLAAGGAFGEEDWSLAAKVTQDLPFDVNLFCCTGESAVAAVLNNSALRRDRRYSIGMWPWELPEWPRLWQHAFGFIDELWAASRFTYDAYCRATPVRVRHMPMSVTVGLTEGAERSDFGLPEGKFLFAYAFDGLSTFTRKNPEACVDAFLRAFPNPDDPVGLVIKGLRAQGEAWDNLSIQIEHDPRITLISDSLSRGRLLDLYRAIDCFLSLHRSEGFGRNIAEAMLLGKPVIVTAHSGNMDFTSHDSAALVPGRLVTLRDGDYPYGSGQVWANADVAVAAKLMQRMVTDHEWRRRIAQVGKCRIEQLFSPRAVGQRWADVLQAIRNERT